MKDDAKNSIISNDAVRISADLLAAHHDYRR